MPESTYFLSSVHGESVRAELFSMKTIPAVFCIILQGAYPSFTRGYMEKTRADYDMAKLVRTFRM